MEINTHGTPRSQAPNACRTLDSAPGDPDEPRGAWGRCRSCRPAPAVWCLVRLQAQAPKGAWNGCDGHAGAHGTPRPRAPNACCTLDSAPGDPDEPQGAWGRCKQWMCSLAWWMAPDSIS